MWNKNNLKYIFRNKKRKPNNFLHLTEKNNRIISNGRQLVKKVNTKSIKLIKINKNDYVY